MNYDQILRKLDVPELKGMLYPMKQDFARIIAAREDTAHEEISKKLQKRKGISKEEADEQAGKILSAAKGKGKKGEKKEPSKEEPKETIYEIINGYPLPPANLKSEGLARIRVEIKSSSIDKSEELARGIKDAMETAERQLARSKVDKNEERAKKLKQIGTQTKAYLEALKKKEGSSKPSMPHPARVIKK